MQARSNRETNAAISGGLIIVGLIVAVVGVGITFGGGACTIAAGAALYHFGTIVQS